VPEDQLHAFLTWYSATRPETRPQRMHNEKHDLRLATRRDDDVDDADNNNRQRRGKLAGNECRSPPASEHSGEAPVAVTPNRWFLHGATLSPRPRVTCDDVDSGSASDGEGEYHDRPGERWVDERPCSQLSFDDYISRPATRRHKYASWCERKRQADSDVRDDDVTAHLSLGGVTEQHSSDVAEQMSITRHDDDDDDDDDDNRRARSAHRLTMSPADHRRSVDCASLRHHTQCDTAARHDITDTPQTPSHCDTQQSQNWPGVTRSQSCSYSLSPPRHHPTPFNVATELRSQTAAAPPLPPGPLSHELVRHLREQQVLRLAAVSRAIHHQLRYLHHGGSGATSPSNSTALYPPTHRQFDASLLLGAGATTSYALHDSIMPNFHATDLALTSSRDSPGDSDVSNDNASGKYSQNSSGVFRLSPLKQSSVFIGRCLVTAQQNLLPTQQRFGQTRQGSALDVSLYKLLVNRSLLVIVQV